MARRAKFLTSCLLIALIGNVVVFPRAWALMYGEVAPTQGSVLGAIATGVPITNIQSSAITLTSATITWTTAVPSTSQVVLVDSDGQAVKRYPEFRDSALVTSHSITLSDLVPNTTYIYYVVSVDASGNIGNSVDGVTKRTFTTLAVDQSAPLSFRFDTIGSQNVYAGSDLYIQVTAVSLGGVLAHVYEDSVAGMPAGSYAHLMCRDIDSTPTVDSDDVYTDLTTKKIYCYVRSDIPQTNTTFWYRIRTSPMTPAGSYTAVFNMEISGIKKQINYPFTVHAAPPPVVKQAITSVPPIPDMQRWEQTMTMLGEKWCNPTEVMSWGYEPQIWYYDGGRSYLQVADYTKDPAKWYPCAMNILNQYRDRVISRNGGYEGWRVFPQGLAMNYWRSGDDLSKQAAILLSKNSAYATKAGAVSDGYVRETAYLIEAYVYAEWLGEPRNPQLAKAVDFALGHFDKLFVSRPNEFNQTFFDGIMAEALIDYYQMTKDPRIPPTIKTMLDWLWQYDYNPATHTLYYDPSDVPPRDANELVNLAIPAYAWYWQLTGDNTYLQRGDDLFAHALDVDISWSGKQYNQNYRWSFDYVRWRSNLPSSGTWQETNTPTYVAQVQNHPPQVDAGFDTGIMLPVTSLVLHGSVTDQENNLTGYSWSKVSGPGTVTFTNSASLTPTASFSSAGTYVLQLSASDTYTTASDTVTVTVGDSWYNAAWGYRKALVVDHTKVSGTQLGFPLLISFTDPDFKSVANGGKVGSSSGADLLVTNAGNALMPFEVETYNPATGQVVIWVKADISSAADLTLYLYFGNAVATSQQNKNAVWDSNYRGVWHMNTTSGTSYPDSTSNNNNAAGTSSALVPTAGMIGGAVNMKVTPAGTLSVPASSSLSLGNSLTYEAWVKFKAWSYPTSYNVLSHGQGPVTLQLNSDNSLLSFIPQCCNVALSSPSVIPFDQWVYIAYTRNGLGATHQLYLNGQPLPLVTNNSTNGFSGGTTGTSIGNASSIMDETRISSIPRSTEWIKTEYLNQSSPQTFMSVSSLQTSGTATTNPGDTTPPAISGVAVSNITSSTATISWTTNESADTQVEYGATTAYGSLSSLNSVMVTSHNTVLSGLAPSASYHFRVRSKDAAGNLAVSPDQTFVTTAVTPIVGDLNSDGLVNSLDYSIMSSHWNQVYAAADLNSDGLVNSLDFAILKSNWGK